MHTDAAEIDVGTRLGHYEIIRMIGSGGMGRVYLARDYILGRSVAIKLVTSPEASDSINNERFLREARAAAALDHQNICSVYEIAEDKGLNFIVLQYIDGDTLAERLRSGPLTPRNAIEIAASVAEALAAAHARGIIHRDVKPENVMLTRADQVKVMDFGLAKIAEETIGGEDETRQQLTASGVILGTVGYMSPEQARGESLDERSDIFSLGVVLYEMISGKAPFEAGSRAEILAAILTRDPPPLSSYSPGVPPGLQNVVSKMLAKDRNERPSSMSQVLALLKHCLQHSDVSPHFLTTEKIGTTIPTRGLTRTKYLLTLPVAVTAVLLLAALSYQFFYSRPIGAPQIRSIAVLPLENLSGDPSQEYFADGMTDELITEIAKFGDVQVIARGSVMRFKNSSTPVPEVARQLGVDAVVTGSVVRAGDRARITVQLIRADTDRHLWAETYERDLKDVLMLQRDIALNVGQQISARVAGQQRLATQERQIDPAAHEAYLKGLYYSNKNTPESKTKALDYFTEAVRLSPIYPEAHANIAECYLDLGGWFAVRDRDEALPKARAAVTEALRQDESLAKAHVVLGWLRQEYEWDWDAAEREFRRAVELNPSFAEAHLLLAKHLLLVGRLDEVPTEVERARQADPLSLPDVSLGSWVLEYAGQHQSAVDRMKTVVQMDPDSPYNQFMLGLVYMDGGELGQAANQFRTAMRMYDAFGKFKAHLAFVLARSGDKQQARKLLNELIETHNIVSFDVGLVMAGLGEQEQAIDWLEKAYQERSIEMIHLRVLATPNTNERPFYFLRNNPRFKDLMHRMNFSEPL